MTFPAYPHYRDSGVEWLGAVPTYWESWKISHAFGELGSGTTPPTSEAEWYEDGTVPWVTTGELRESVIWETKKLLSSTALSAFSALRLHPAGSLAIAMYGATIGRLGILGVDATTNQACCLLTRPNHLHVKFTFYWLLVFKQSIIDLYASGGGQPNINQEIIANLKVPAPGVPEQTQIARFLDHETARIDALIEEQQRLIELLKEKRQAVISHAVTKGLDPTVPMKDSGVEWLGKVPAAWNVKSMKHISSLKGRLGWQGLKAEEYREEGPFVVSSAHFNNLTIDWDACPRVSVERYDLDSNIQLCEGDVLLMKDGAALGKLAYIDHLPDRACLNSHLLLFRPLLTNRCVTYISTFLFFLMRTEYFQKHITLYATGSTFAGISQEKIGNYRVALPPLGMV